MRVKKEKAQQKVHMQRAASIIGSAHCSASLLRARAYATALILLEYMRSIDIVIYIAGKSTQQARRKQIVIINII